MSLSEEDFSKLSLETEPIPESGAEAVVEEGDNQLTIRPDADQPPLSPLVEEDSQVDVLTASSEANVTPPPSLDQFNAEGTSCSPAMFGLRDDVFSFIDEAAEEPATLQDNYRPVISDGEPHFQQFHDVIPEDGNEYFESSEGPVSELEGYNFLDESDKSECRSIKSDEEGPTPKMCGFPGTPSASPRSEGGGRSKARAPLPPTDGDRPRSTSFSDGGISGPPCRPACNSALVRYQMYHPHKIRFLQLSYNTNLRKPPENWLRMKHKHHSEGTKHHFGSSFWSYPFSKSSSWSMFSSFRYGSSAYGRSKRSGRGKSGHLGMHNFDLTNCLCCSCCNCSQTNQTCCCCCYHCQHMISSCRRSDLLRLVPVAGTPTKGPGGIPPSILKKPKVLVAKKPKKVAPPGPEPEAKAVESDEPSVSETKEEIKERGV